MEEGTGGLTEKLPSHAALGPLSVQSGSVVLLQFPIPILGQRRERRSQVLQNCVGVLPPSVPPCAAAHSDRLGLIILHVRWLGSGTPPPPPACSQYQYMHIIPPAPLLWHRNGTRSERLEPLSSSASVLFRFFIRPHSLSSDLALSHESHDRVYEGRGAKERSGTRRRREKQSFADFLDV